MKEAQAQIVFTRYAPFPRRRSVQARGLHLVSAHAKTVEIADTKFVQRLSISVVRRFPQQSDCPFGLARIAQIMESQVKPSISLTCLCRASVPLRALGLPITKRRYPSVDHHT